MQSTGELVNVVVSPHLRLSWGWFSHSVRPSQAVFVRWLVKMYFLGV